MNGWVVILILILGFALAVAAVAIAFGFSLIVGIAWLINRIRGRRPQPTGEFVDGQELDARDPIDRIIVASRAAAAREDRAKREVELRSWR